MKVNRFTRVAVKVLVAGVVAGAVPAVVATAAQAPSAAAATQAAHGPVAASVTLSGSAGRGASHGKWVAGARVVDASGYEQCTAGFTGRARNGQRYVLTGFHCINPHNHGVSGVHATVGTATSTISSLDLAAVKASATSPYVYTGNWNSTAAARRVTKVAAPHVGQKICTSGSFSGLRCYATVRGTVTAQLRTAWGTTYTATLWYATSDNGSEIIRAGDSGGPVFVPTGAHTVTAVGEISAGYDGGVRCAGAPGGSRSTCYRTVLFSSVATDAARLHLDLTH